MKPVEQKLADCRADIKEVRQRLREAMELNQKLFRDLALVNERARILKLVLVAINTHVREMMDETNSFGAINGNSLIKWLNKL